MKLINTFMTGMLMLALSTGSVSAQDSDSARKYHPFLSENFHIGLGVYRPAKKTTLGGNTNIASGAAGSLEGSDDQSTGSLNFRWRFTKNWHFQTTYWATDSSTQQTLTEDFTFNPGGPDETVFQAGSFVGMGVDTTIARLFWGRSFFRKPNHDWGVGLGLHWLEIDAFVEGNAVIGGGPNEFRRESASASVPLPNLGIWYMWSWSPNWVLASRFDWLEVTVDEFSGSMYDVSVGVNYQMSKHFGMGFAVNGFVLDVDFKGDNAEVGLKNEQIGPRLNVTWNW